MKKGIILLILLILVIILCGCGRTADADAIDGHGKRFMCIESSFLGDVYVDTETGVEWLRVDCRIQPIIDSYGKPYIYPAFDAREDALQGRSD